ncbi:MFS transporter [Virgibacillus sp. W0181]|uniref:MFS transporter n=1 Tax=Virgibacillus sp. W0181 TaxID=3391581 RepID=UPI003F454552
MVSDKMRYWILISLVTISGFSQGMLLPLIAIILEQSGVSSSVNGIHATGLYIGILLASPFMEKLMHRLGFKPIIVVGGMLVFISLFLFPLWHSLWFWFILRMIIGIGDQMLHFGTQTWITSTVEEKTRGKSIAIYGLAFGLGFAVGPLMTKLLAINTAMPFIVSAIISMIVWSTMFFINNHWPEQTDTLNRASVIGRFIQTAKIAWVALLPPFGYGFLEATLHGVFPVYGLRIGHDVDLLALIIPCFAIGSIIFQLPLGSLSDRFGRRNILLLSLTLGTIFFTFAAILEHFSYALIILFVLAGMFVGSLYSLGITYMVDVLPKALLPAGNLMMGIAFSLGSMTGPFFGGLFIQIFPGISLFYVIVTMMVLIGIAIYFKKDPSR